jgi:hypothetical protein
MSTKQKQRQRRPKIQAKIRKAPDLEMHVTTQFAAGREFVEIRDYIPSTQTYGRGVAFEKQHLGRLAGELQDLDRRISPSSPEAQIPGQLSLDLDA